MLFFHSKTPVIKDMEATLHKLKSKDSRILDALDSDPQSTLAGLSAEDKRLKAISELEKAIAAAKHESEPEGHTYHSRDPLTGITQSHLSRNSTTEDLIADNVIPEMQAYGQGNPVVWIPTGIDGILEHFKPKAKFKIATPERSEIHLPEKCKIALLADWGADNDHAKRLGDLAVARVPNLPSTLEISTTPGPSLNAKPSCEIGRLRGRKGSQSQDEALRLMAITRCIH